MQPADEFDPSQQPLPIPPTWPTPPPLPPDVMPQATTVQPPPLPAPAIVADTPCVGCGYNVRSMELTAMCPECGTPVAATLDGGLRHAPEDYLRRMVLATRLIHWGMIAYCGGAVFFGLLGVLFGDWLSAVGLPAGPMRGSGGGIMLWTLIIVVPVITMLLGFWMFLTPHPGMAENRQPKTARLLTRVAVGIAAVAALSTAGTTIVAATRTGATANAMAGMGAVTGCMGCAGVPLLLGLLLPPLAIVTWLANLDTDESSAILTKRAKRLYWLLPVLVVASPAVGYGLFLIGVFGSIGAGFGGSGSRPDTGSAGFIMAVVLGCGTPLVCLIAAMVLIWHIFFHTYKLLSRSLQARLLTVAAIGTPTPQENRDEQLGNS
ncbi:hypothetical protein LBMAG48_11210 [Phycisphaerae bacterium]|nr:hypothetical protein LBMAG48_11210 [Phycisphaerae bacterium]